jgi:hypothetical protein
MVTRLDEAQLLAGDPLQVCVGPTVGELRLEHSIPGAEAGDLLPYGLHLSIRPVGVDCALADDENEVEGRQTDSHG